MISSNRSVQVQYSLREEITIEGKVNLLYGGIRTLYFGIGDAIRLER